MINRFRAIFFNLASIAALVGASLVVYGLSRMTWPSAIPFSGEQPLLRFVLVLLITAFLVSSITVITKWKPLLATGAIVLLLALGSGLMGPFAVVAWFALSSTLLGQGVLRFMRMERTAPRASIVQPFLIGAGLYGTLVGVLAHFPINYPSLYAILLSLPIAFGWRAVKEFSGKTEKLIVRSDRTVTSVLLLDGCIGVLLIVYVLVACLPELGYDALAMHLFIPGYLRGRHQWTFDVTTYVWAVMPMLGDWIFAIAYMLGGETAARLLNVGFIFVLARLVVEMVRWAGGTARSAHWAALIFLSTPLTFTEGSSLFIESVWSAFLVAGSYMLIRSVFRKDSSNNLPLTAVLLGFAAASKAVTLTVLPVLALVLIFCWRRLFCRSNILILGLALMLFIVVSMPPYLTAFIKTGNPVFPLFNLIFRSPLFPLENFAPPDVFAKGVQFNTLYEVTFDTKRYLESRSGAAGFHWLLFLTPALLILMGVRNVRGLLVGFVGLTFIWLTFQSTAYLRYVFPSFALLAAVLGIGFSVIGNYLVAVRFAGVLLASGALLNLLFFNAGAFYADFDPRAAFSESLRRDYIQQRIPIRNAVELVNRLNQGHTPVAVFSMPYAAGLESDALYPNWYNFNFHREIESAVSEVEIANVLLVQGVDFLILDPTWNTPQKRHMIESATDKIANFGGISIRSLSNRYRFQKELLQHPDFDSAEGWTILTGAKLENGLVANVSGAAFQVVAVSAGHRYRNLVRAVCAGESTKGRLQVNWQDARSQFIRADIKLFDCSSEPTNYDMEVIAPDGAAAAAVYASGHTQIPVVFKQVSFKR